ncbi:MAG: hypothetical protein IT340_22495 [Chloroflexi bacterium]|nr:hypothetical protein [Chloroflexota bacterium]
MDHLTSADRLRNRALAALTQETGIGVVAANMAAFAAPEDGPLHDVLAAIRHRTTVQQADGRLALNREAYLKAAGEMEALFAWCPAAIPNAGRVAAACAYRLDAAGERLPSYPLPAGETAYSYLRVLALRGAEERYRPMTPAADRRLTHELAIIEQLGWSGYFLVIWDIVRFARERGIRVQGRGSAANSVVAYVLGVTSVDPLQFDLLFERFLSPQRTEAPDVDLDVERDRREEVIAYLYDRYGRDKAAMVCEYICWRARSAARDVRRALGLAGEVEATPAAGAGGAAGGGGAAGAAAAADAPLAAGDDPAAQVARLCRRVDGLPRHLGIHVGGMLLTARPLIESVPVERATMDGRTVSIWDKDDLERALPRFA